MAKNVIVINVDLRETRICLIEDGVIAELQIERASARGTVGNVVLGKVTRVLPGMQAAFIDIGQERAAFLHVEDLIRPDDFEAYLAGGAREEGQRAASAVEPGAEPEATPGAPAGHVAIIPGEAASPESVATEEAVVAEAAQPRRRIVAPRYRDSDEADAAEADAAEADAAAESTEGPSDDDELLVAPGGSDEADDTDESEGPEDDDDEEEGDEDDEDTEEATEESLAAPIEGADAAESPLEEAGPSVPSGPVPADRGGPPDRQDSRGDGGGRNHRRRRGRKGGRDRDRREPQQDVRGRKGGRPNRAPLRVSRSVPITEVVKEGDEVVVQVSKEPIGTKGARVTSHVSLPGRYAVYLPTVEHVGISKRIGSGRERSRLREVIDSVKPPKGGLIVRTVAEGLTKKQLKADVGYLVRVWEEVARRREGAKAPTTLYSELDLLLKVARDYFTDEVEKIVVDDEVQHGRLCRFVEMFQPGRSKDVELYNGEEPIFDAYGIEDEIGRALSRKVPLRSGGYLIIDQAEALTAIDVNTGRFVGKGSKDLEETALKTNLEAVDEIAYQLRFRNIGGLVILDLIDMERGDNREKVWRALEQRLAKDKAKTTLNRISELGLVEMTRKRTRESLGRVMHEPCFYCDGTGQIQSRATIAYEILRQIRRERKSLPGYSVVVNAHPAIIDFLQVEEKEALADAERRFTRRIELHSRTEYHIEQFDLQGK